MNSLINCHIVSWKRFLQTGLELIFVHIQIKTWWMILSSAKQINLNATCSKRPIKRSISDLTHKYAHTAIILYIYNSSYSDPFVLKSHHHYHITCSNSILAHHVKSILLHQEQHFQSLIPEAFPLQSEPYPQDSPPGDHNPTLL